MTFTAKNAGTRARSIPKVGRAPPVVERLHVTLVLKDGPAHKQISLRLSSSSNSTSIYRKRQEQLATLNVAWMQRGVLIRGQYKFEMKLVAADDLPRPWFAFGRYSSALMSLRPQLVRESPGSLNGICEADPPPSESHYRG